MIFKDEIHAKTKSEINKRLNATVDFKDFGLSFFSNFPYLSINIDKISVTGKNDFSKDTLITLKELQVAVNVMNVINGEKIEIKKIILDEPNIHAINLEDGRSNWDIVIPDTVPETAPDTAKSSFQLRLSKIKVIKANIRYDDKKSSNFVTLNELNFTGAGDLSADNFEFETGTEIEKINFIQGKTKLISNVRFESEVNISVDTRKNSYQIMDNKFKINELQLGLNGNVSMPPDSSIVLDLTFQALETQFKEILSLVPGIYTEKFGDIKTEGSFNLDGKVKGVYFQESIPTFSVNLNIKDGFLQYPDLPAPMKNIQLNLNASNSTSDINNTVINIKKFHTEFESNPIDLELLVQNFKNPNLDGKLTAKVDLGKITRVFPIEKFDLKGLLNTQVKFKGSVSDSTLPTLSGTFDFKYGYAKYKEFPAALDNLTITAKAECPTGNKKDMHIEVSNFHTEIDKEPLEASLVLDNLISPAYKLKLSGSIDLGKITKIFPIEGTTLTGKILANVDTEGSVNKIEQKEYANLPTTGKIECKDITYSAKDIAHRVTIQKAILNFNPQFLTLSDYEGTVGSSDIKLSGRIENHIGYVLNGEKISGKMSLISNKFNCNEWLSKDEPSNSKSEEKPLEPIDIPANIDFVFESTINEVLYDKWEISDLKGLIAIKDKKVEMEDLQFLLAGAKFKLKGLYDSHNITNPSYQFDMKIDSLKYIEAFKNFVAIQKLAPIAEKIEGIFNAKLSLGGLLNREMMPVYESLSATGGASIYRTKISSIPILQKLSETTKINNYNEIAFKAASFLFQIIDGKLYFDPFDVKIGQSIMTVSGYNALDQSIGYKLKLNVPAPAVTKTAADALSKLTNKEINASERVNIDLRLAGTYLKPMISGGGIGGGDGDLLDKTKETLKDEINKQKDAAMEKLDKKKKELEEKAKAELDHQREILETKAREEKERIAREAEQKKQELERQAREEVERKKREAEQKAREEVEKKKKEAEQKIKDKIKFPR